MNAPVITDETIECSTTRPEENLTVSAQRTQPTGHQRVSASAPNAQVTIDELPCRRYPADLWFAESPEDVERAKALCLDCPLAQACLDGAIDRREPWGVWGGQLLLQGQVVARKRPRGRPRKNPVAA